MGGSGLTLANGLELEPGATIEYAVAHPSEVYCICASGSPELRVQGV